MDTQSQKRLAELVAKEPEALSPAQFLPTYRAIQKLVQDGKADNAQKAVEALSDDEYKLYQSLKKKGVQ